MGILKGQEIHPVFTSSSKGKIASLQWTLEDIDSKSEIIEALSRGEKLYNYSGVGLSPTQWGELAWALFAVDSLSNFHNGGDLLWFSLILPPDKMKEGGDLWEWLQALTLQKELNLAITIKNNNNELTHSCTLLKRERLNVYASMLKKAADRWEQCHNYDLASTYLLDHAMAQIRLNANNAIERSFRL